MIGGAISRLSKGYKQDRFVAEIEQGETLNEQLATLLRMSLQYVLQSKLIAHFDSAKEVIDRDVRSMEERFKAGAARLAEMRQARLVGLEAEARLGQAERQRDLVTQAMKTQFAISPQQAAQLIDSFRKNRPEVPDSVPGPVSPRARLIKHNIDKVMAEGQRLSAERLPSFTGVVTARGWDIGGVYPGQIAQVSLSAYDVSRYGNLEGEVQRIAQNTTQEQNMPPFYETLIAIPIPKLSKSDDEVEIVPGMTVMVDLIGQKRTVLNYIMTPLNRAVGVAFREN